MDRSRWSRSMAARRVCSNRIGNSTLKDMKKIISTDRAPKAIGPYSQAVVIHGFAFLSGQIPIDPETNKLIEGDVVAQTLRVLENIKIVLEACGSSWRRW